MNNFRLIDETLAKVIKVLDAHHKSRPYDGNIFHIGAKSFAVSLVPALVDLARGTNKPVDLNTILEYADYIQYCSLLDNPSISVESRQSMTEFIKTRAGFQEHLPFESQTEDVRKQFEFAERIIVGAVLNTQGKLMKNPYSPRLQKHLTDGARV